jgi:Na+-translocating ferredoxin:NAD+ oxidoreductase RnfG subunit
LVAIIATLMCTCVYYVVRKRIKRKALEAKIKRRAARRAVDDDGGDDDKKEGAFKAKKEKK